VVIKRGEIRWASLPAPEGSEPGFRRPVLVISADAFNRSAIQTVVALAVTSNLALAQAPGNVTLARKESGLPRKSVVNVSQVVTLNKLRLQEKMGALSPALMGEVEAGLRHVLGLRRANGV
jgi:mRNA interferase MazF